MWEALRRYFALHVVDLDVYASCHKVAVLARHSCNEICHMKHVLTCSLKLHQIGFIVLKRRLLTAMSMTIYLKLQEVFAAAHKNIAKKLMSEILPQLDKVREKLQVFKQMGTFQSATFGYWAQVHRWSSYSCDCYLYSEAVYLTCISI